VLLHSVMVVGKLTETPSVAESSASSSSKRSSLSQMATGPPCSAIVWGPTTANFHDIHVPTPFFFDKHCACSIFFAVIDRLSWDRLFVTGLRSTYSARFCSTHALLHSMQRLGSFIK
jgi:hypothetical protein